MMRRVVCLPACLPACLSKHMLVLVGMWHLIWDLTTAPIKVPLERRTEMLKGSIQFATREWGVFAVYLTNRGGKTSVAGKLERRAGRARPSDTRQDWTGRKMCNAGRLSSQVYRASLSDDLSK
ncbi:hypothetical protein CPAR01_01233 [Colletotrichum paranaense]|uniref:Secreted protein n=1 Tax=Colletotrichum paranaense TaxID=1914294 RepID=A0ABQ9T7Z1_9PEZI|nr:uncharacterized protein CPAR01_01233 [Colletotrichum paranaense]KAK1547266.1 hypothetical protein CPAR01_01233 [Colletotrichum paranaense]